MKQRRAREFNDGTLGLTKSTARTSSEDREPLHTCVEDGVLHGRFPTKHIEETSTTPDIPGKGFTDAANWVTVDQQDTPIPAS